MIFLKAVQSPRSVLNSSKGLKSGPHEIRSKKVHTSYEWLPYIITHGKLLTVQIYADEFPSVNPGPQIQLKVCLTEQRVERSSGYLA